MSTLELSEHTQQEPTFAGLKAKAEKAALLYLRFPNIVVQFYRFGIQPLQLLLPCSDCGVKLLFFLQSLQLHRRIYTNFNIFRRTFSAFACCIIPFRLRT